MAATWYAPVIGSTFAATKCLAYVLNAAGSGKIVRVYRVWAISYSAAAATAAAMPLLEVHRISAVTTPTTVTPVKADTASAALPAQITAGYATSQTSTYQFSRIVTTPDEAPAVGAALATSSIPTLIPWALIWDSGYNSNGDGRDPFVVREGEGFSIYTSAGGAAGQRDFWIEFTVT
jgi:hypothetical protein